jgi:hypothetical protein
MFPGGVQVLEVPKVCERKQPLTHEQSGGQSHDKIVINNGKNWVSPLYVQYQLLLTVLYQFLLHFFAFFIAKINVP